MILGIFGGITPVSIEKRLANHAKLLEKAAMTADNIRQDIKAAIADRTAAIEEIRSEMLTLTGHLSKL